MTKTSMVTNQVDTTKNWDGIIHFEDVTLQEVMEKQFNGSIEILDKRSVRYRFSGKFNNEKL